MARTIHGFQSERVFLHIEREHMFRIVGPMTGSLPEFSVVNVRRDDFLETSFPIFLLDELYEGVVDVGASRLEEARPRGEFVEEEQLLFFTDFPMVAFGRFFLDLLPLFQLFAVWETNPVHSL